MPPATMGRASSFIPPAFQETKLGTLENDLNHHPLHWQQRSPSRFWRWDQQSVKTQKLRWTCSRIQRNTMELHVKYSSCCDVLIMVNMRWQWECIDDSNNVKVLLKPVYWEASSSGGGGEDGNEDGKKQVVSWWWVSIRFQRSTDPASICLASSDWPNRLLLQWRCQCSSVDSDSGRKI